MKNDEDKKPPASDIEWTKYERIDDRGPWSGQHQPTGAPLEDRIAQGGRKFWQDFLAAADTPSKRWGVVVMGASIGCLVLVFLLSYSAQHHIGYALEQMFEDRTSTGYWRSTRLGLLTFSIGFCMWLGLADKLLRWIRFGGSRQ